MKETGELRVPFRKTAARGKRAHPHRGAATLRHLHGKIHRLRAIDARSDHEGWRLAVGESRDQRVHRIRIGSDLAADAARVDRLRLVGPVVDRHRDERRAAGRLHRGVVGPRDGRGHVLGPRRFDAVFDIGAWEFRGAFGVEECLQRQNAAGLLAGGDHHRRLVAMRGIDVAERMADAGGRVQVDEGGIAGRLGIAVGHADDGGFLQPQHVLDVIRPVAQEWQFGRARIAEHLLDAEAAQQIEGRLLDADRCAIVFCGFGGHG